MRRALCRLLFGTRQAALSERRGGGIALTQVGRGSAGGKGRRSLPRTLRKPRHAPALVLRRFSPLSPPPRLCRPPHCTPHSGPQGIHARAPSASRKGQEPPQQQAAFPQLPLPVSACPSHPPCHRHRPSLVPPNRDQRLRLRPLPPGLSLALVKARSCLAHGPPAARSVL